MSIIAGILSGDEIFENFQKIEKYQDQEGNQKRQEGKKRGEGGACSTSYPSGNQVDGLPLVAIPKQ